MGIIISRVNCLFLWHVELSLRREEGVGKKINSIIWSMSHTVKIFKHVSIITMVMKRRRFDFSCPFFFKVRWNLFPSNDEMMCSSNGYQTIKTNTPPENYYIATDQQTCIPQKEWNNIICRSIDRWHRMQEILSFDCEWYFLITIRVSDREYDVVQQRQWDRKDEREWRRRCV